MSPAPNTTKPPSLWKEALALLLLMLVLVLVGFGLGWHKGHTIWQTKGETQEEY